MKKPYIFREIALDMRDNTEVFVDFPQIFLLKSWKMVQKALLVHQI